MSPTEQAVEQAIEGLEKPVPAKAEAPTAPEIKKIDDKPVEEKPADGKDPKDAEGYLANEIDPVKEEPVKPKEEVKAEEVDTSGLNPEERYIVDNLPMIVARVKDGDKIKELQVKSWTQLPEDLEFASKRDELAFMNALTAQEHRARDLQVKFQQEAQQTQNTKFEQAENDGIRQDISELQQAGDLPKFKLKPEDKGFNDDPTTKSVQEILNYMEERNKQYLAEYNQGRPFRHIGFREAFYMFERKKPETPQGKEDAQRKEIADKVNGNRSLSNRELKKPTVKAGTRVGDILDRIDQEEW